MNEDQFNLCGGLIYGSKCFAQLEAYRSSRRENSSNFTTICDCSPSDVTSFFIQFVIHISTSMEVKIEKTTAGTEHINQMYWQRD